MQSLLVYSSRTGNTRKIAETVFELLPNPKQLYPVENAPDPALYDLIIIGFWNSNGEPDEKSRAFAQKIHGKKICIFGTAGTYPDSEHAKECMIKMEDLLTGNEIIGGFMCQGSPGETAPQWLKKLPPEKEDQTPRHRSPVSTGKNHPDEKDLANAKTAFKAMLRKLEQ